MTLYDFYTIANQCLTFLFIYLAFKYKGYELLYKKQLRKDVLADLQLATFEQIENEIKNREIKLVMIRVDDDQLVIDSINMDKRKLVNTLNSSIKIIKSSRN
jgi:hypothetical protein